MKGFTHLTCPSFVALWSVNQPHLHDLVYLTPPEPEAFSYFILPTNITARDPRNDLVLPQSTSVLRVLVKAKNSYQVQSSTLTPYDLRDSDHRAAQVSLSIDQVPVRL